eukprot:1317561-Prymnesium_polylepis.1
MRESCLCSASAIDCTPAHRWSTYDLSCPSRPSARSWRTCHMGGGRGCFIRMAGSRPSARSWRTRADAVWGATGTAR